MDTSEPTPKAYQSSHQTVHRMPPQYHYVLLGSHNPGIYKQLCVTCQIFAQYLSHLQNSPFDLPPLPFCFVIQCGNFEEAEEVFLLRPLVLQLQTLDSTAQLIESLSDLLPRLVEVLKPLPRNLSSITVLYKGHCRGIFLDMWVFV